MEITYLGHSSFRIKGKQAVVVTDPYGEMAGKYPRDVEADIVTISHAHADHNEAKLVKGTPFVIDGPGEYEIKNISVVGVATWHDEKDGAERGRNTVFVIEVEGLRIAHLGDLGHALTPEQLAEMGSVDVVMVPVGGKYTLDAKTAAEVVRQVDPWVAIPMHYKSGESKLSGELAGVEEFLKQMSKETVEPVNKWVMTADKLPSDLQVVVLEKK